MNLKKKIRYLSLLKDEILQIIEKEDAIIQKVHKKNEWFVPAFIKIALQAISLMLEENKLIKWLSGYPVQDTVMKDIGLVMAGNIPMVGFHDLICVLLSGNRAIIKLSHNDDILIPHIVSLLERIEPGIKGQIAFKKSIQKVNAVIATGSDNSSRYFKYSYKSIPHLIRKNRTSCSILAGSESITDIEELSSDIFSYFGLGCRNVSKIYLPKNFEIYDLISNLGKFRWIIDHPKYYNNYKYQISKNLLEDQEFIDGRFFILSKSRNLVSPIACLYFEEYENLKTLESAISFNEDKIQCIVSKNGWFENSMSFGMVQFPEPWDYADNIDTMDFLVGI